jgi:hypothetical protein
VLERTSLQVGKILCVLLLTMGKIEKGIGNNAQITNQAEDVIDILHGLFPNHDLEFHVDNSSGHTKKRKDSLNVNVMNFGWGGNQPYMRPSQLTDGSSIGHRPKASTLISQKKEERGPWYLSDDEREARKYDRPTDKMITKEKTTAMLRMELKITAMDRNKY